MMDMDSGAVLFAQNIHVQLPPASITKLLTALVVAEHASMDEQVTFSHDAVYNVNREAEISWAWKRGCSVCEGQSVCYAFAVLQSGSQRPGRTCGREPRGFCGHDEMKSRGIRLPGKQF